MAKHAKSKDAREWWLAVLNVIGLCLRVVLVLLSGSQH